MRVYISHAEKDRVLFKKLASALKDAGFKVWNPYHQIYPGDNWAKKIGRALEKSEFMIVLLTPGAFKSENVQKEIQFAMAGDQFAHKVFTLLVGSAFQKGKDVPWVLYKIPHRKVKRLDDVQSLIRDIPGLVPPVPV